MKIEIGLKEFLNHLRFWQNKTDDECIELATNENGLDAERALINLMERDFCSEINNNFVEEWIKISKEK